MITAARGTAQVQGAVAELNLALRTHGGAVECTGVHGDTVRLRMTGLCAGCLFKPVTTEATIRPFIAERLGMDVEVEGARVSVEAQQRLARAFRTSAFDQLSIGGES